MKLPSQKYGQFKFPNDYDVIRTATLNKTDLAGGNNKFYHIEAHVSKDKKHFRLYSRYGRVGQQGMEEERVPTQDEPSLLAAFESLKKEKTGTKKGYVEVKMAAVKVGSAVANVQILSDDIKKDKLTKDDKDIVKLDVHETVKTLVDRLYQEAGQAVRNQLSGSLNSTTENPLGTLTLSQIDTGRKALQDIQKLLNDKPKLQGSIHDDLIDLSNMFYSAIPQKIEHRPKPSAGESALKEWLKKMVLNDATRLDEKEDLLKLLSDVQGMVSGFASSDLALRYKEIGCEYSYLDPSDENHKRITKYANDTRSSNHRWGSTIKNIWKINAAGQDIKHKDVMSKIGNIKPLFHGSRPANILGICKSGLLLRPPGVYITGSMFGNGLYFADQSSKSEQYAWGWGSNYGSGSYFMFVADVALGKIKEYSSSQSNLTKAPSGFDSVQGVKGNYLLHNEFIIYDIRQHKLDYLIEFQPK